MGWSGLEEVEQIVPGLADTAVDDRMVGVG